VIFDGNNYIAKPTQGKKNNINSNEITLDQGIS